MKDNETLLKDLRAELAELNEKIVKLLAFMHGENASRIPEDHAALLVEQRTHMLRYADVLRDRIRLVLLAMSCEALSRMKI